MTDIIRPHVALPVTNIDAAVAFYAALFDQQPAKRKPGYAKFDLRSPALNLSLNETPKANGTSLPQHFGIEVTDSEAVKRAHARVKAAGLQIELEEEAVTCCYAVQDKFWVRDPDGHAWEVFTVLEDAEVHTANRKVAKPKAETQERDCCAPTCCT